ncbi:MFS transporter [Beggiatoa leptomitoformis]|uniref:MFS transporter n=1 Tax=Beggiatoa leptomitoformis TaxID=288004 RepID=A0A2N9YAC7_9GAMM|nr:MFS transporter [Beggiatoa leptomitoformis]ALG67178.1 MFS transporter [Beggiatoa leptomitoformis]AUI67417.1 MFS transporter [Beggiatoa leptomitoformis]
MQTPSISERALIIIVFAIQFVNIVDFMMVMPLGADFAKDLAIDTAHIGIIGGSYTIGAAISAIISAFFLDRFDRRTAVFYAMIGLIMATAFCTLATNLIELVTMRVIAGIFAGPLSSLVIAMVIDVIPAERRGQAMGLVISSFSISAVLGVPLGLELARIGGWQAPFLAIAMVSLLVVIATLWFLPPMRDHFSAVQHTSQKTRMLRFFTRPDALLAYSLTALSMLGGFLIIPNISAYVQFNLHYPREALSLLYLAGGTVSFIAMQLAGRWTDRYGSFMVILGASLLLTFVLLFGFTVETVFLPVTIIFAGFMLAMSLRSVAITVIIAKVPDGSERAGFMAVNAAVQHLASAIGGMLSAVLLQSQANGMLIGMWQVGLLSIITTLILPILFWILESRLNRQSIVIPTELALNER